MNNKNMIIISGNTAMISKKTITIISGAGVSNNCNIVHELEHFLNEKCKIKTFQELNNRSETDLLNEKIKENTRQFLNSKNKGYRNKKY
jgi:hypothetical protein